MTVTLNLGGIAFEDFEVPEQINFGGEQALNVHRLPGGTRVVDSLGPDDAEIRWSGRFRGSDAEERAILLDFFRRSGNQQLLSWSYHRYQVVIKDFNATFQQSFEIPYTISCVVLIDETQALIQAGIALIDAMASDLLTATGLGNIIGIQSINTALLSTATAFSNYRAGVPTSTNAIAGTSAVAEAPLLSALQASIGTTQSATQSAIASSNNQLTANPIPPAGSSPATAATALTTQATAMTELGQLFQLNSAVNRMSANTNIAVANGSTALQ